MRVPHNMILQQFPEIREWLSERLPGKPSFDPELSATLAVVGPDGRLAAAVVVYDWKPDMAQVTLGFAVDRPESFTRGVLRFISDYCFNVLGCRRLNIGVKSNNDRSKAVIKKIGFKEEGVMRKGAHDGDDLLLYGLLKEECKWLG